MCLASCLSANNSQLALKSWISTPTSFVVGCEWRCLVHPPLPRSPGHFLAHLLLMPSNTCACRLAYAYGNQLSSRPKLAQSPTSTGSMITKSQRRQSAECRVQSTNESRATQHNATQRNAQRSGTHAGWTTSQQEAPYLYEG